LQPAHLIIYQLQIVLVYFLFIRHGIYRTKIDFSFELFRLVN
jgi:hypothetical protein